MDFDKKTKKGFSLGKPDANILEIHFSSVAELPRLKIK